jgi:hypothetical protein
VASELPAKIAIQHHAGSQEVTISASSLLPWTLLLQPLSVGTISSVDTTIAGGSHAALLISLHDAC